MATLNHISRQALKAYVKQGKYPLTNELRMEFHPDFSTFPDFPDYPDYPELEENTSLLDLEALSKETGLHLLHLRF